MLSLLPLLGLPVLIMAGFWLFNRSTFTWKEFLLLEVIMAVILASGWGLARWGAMQDTEIWSGRITEKVHDSMGCCHCRQVCDTCTRTVTDSNGRSRTESYSCNCRQVCDHARDYYWAVDVSTGDRINIKRCEPRKRNVPQAWKDAYVGEPAVVAHTYENYLLADPESILRHSDPNAEAWGTPSYPKVHSHYKIKRVINDGTKIPVEAWNNALMEINADLGHKKQVNVIVIATKNPSPEYADHIEVQWLYGKKNDAIIVLGAPDGDEVTWARLVTISNVSMMEIKVRDELPGYFLRDTDGMTSHIRHLVQEDFQRTPMAEYEYLASAAKPKTWMMVILYILGILGSVGGSLYMAAHDVFGDERRSRAFRRSPW